MTIYIPFGGLQKNLTHNQIKFINSRITVKNVNFDDTKNEVMDVEILAQEEENDPL